MRKVIYKRIAVIAGVALLAAAMAGCGAVSIEKPAVLAGAHTYDIAGECNIEIDGDTITVSGQTNILDGVLIDISVVGQDGMVIQNESVIKSGDAFSKSFKMTDELYGDVQSVVGYLSCAPKSFGKQTEEVLKVYGEDFEYVNAPEGNYLWDKDGIIVLFASEMVTLEK